MAHALGEEHRRRLRALPNRVGKDTADGPSSDDSGLDLDGGGGGSLAMATDHGIGYWREGALAPWPPDCVLPPNRLLTRAHACERYARWSARFRCACWPQ